MIDKSPEISSFIIRFIHAEGYSQLPQVDGNYRGTIRHILSNQELHFSKWKEAVSFIGQFVPIHENPAGEPSPGSTEQDNPLSGARTAAL